MTSTHFTSGPGEHTTVISRVSDNRWHALEDDLVVGRGEASRRPDGRIFLSVDAWHAATFDRLAGVMLADLPRPLYTVVDEADEVLMAQWRRAGLATRRREWEYLVPTDPRVTGLGAAPRPPGLRILPVGGAREEPLRALDRVIREEVRATVGWQEMPAEVVPRPLLDPAKYAVAAESVRYVGMLRLAVVPRRARIGLIAVRADRRRRGIARALLGDVLHGLHGTGCDAVWAEVNESNAAAVALFDGIGARRTASNVEMVLR